MQKKCHSKINQTEREAIFHEFWGTGNYEKQKEFISKTAIDAPVKRVRASNRSKKRNKSFQYSSTVRGEQIRVCKQFYVDTLDVSHAIIDTALKSRKPFSQTTSNDRRGKQSNRPNVIPSAVKNDIRSHINSFPRVESHYCRKNSSKEYLEANLNLTKMYDEYVKQCQSLNFLPASEAMYRHIFNTEFNIGFHKPLKDQCDFCVDYSLKDDNDRIKMKNEYDRHMKK